MPAISIGHGTRVMLRCCRRIDHTDDSTAESTEHMEEDCFVNRFYDRTLDTVVRSLLPWIVSCRWDFR